jgi:stage II sporulation protein D
MLVQFPYKQSINIWEEFMRSVYLIVISFLVVVLCVPSVIVIAFGTNSVNQKIETLDIAASTYTPPKATSEKENLVVSVYRMSNKDIEKIHLEEYVKGVLASEMPASYELEALKAQAISARTFIIKFLITENKDQVPQGADITDSTLQQVYKNQDELKEMWKNDNYVKNINKITQAVNETQGLVMTYNGELIDASFFAMSNGYTENSEDYWTSPLPYLRSVPSPWDETSPDFIETKKFSSKEIESRLGIKVSSGINIQRTSSKRVASIAVDGKKVTGVEVREALGLRSTDFSFKFEGDNVQVTTKGYGHGVGMSQYGANSMAKEGKAYKEILEYYYTGIKIEDLKSNKDYTDLVVKRDNNS